MIKYSKGLLVGLTVLSIVSVQSGIAVAGGLSVREQSISGLGSAFAGSAAGYDLSSIFWNPAAVSIAKEGITTESHASVIIGYTKIDPTDGQGSVFGAPLDASANEMGKVALVPASYAAWRINDKLTFGYGFNAPFGLSIEADKKGWSGQYLFREGEIKTFNFNPVVGYQISPTLSFGAGLQVQYTELHFRQASQTFLSAPPDPTHPDEKLKGSDWTLGYTLGMLWRPVSGTSIGVGYRSRLNATLEGEYSQPAVGIKKVEADLDLPEMVTVSLRQDITSNMRLLGTFEWTNWSLFKTVKVIDKATGTSAQTTLGTDLQFDGNWNDGYFLSGGLEYDYSDKITLRSGIAYEWSPVQEATQRLISIPDANRLWLSLGATYKWSENTSLDFAYTHIFIDDGDILYSNGFSATSEAAVDIIGVSYKTSWGADGPFGVLKAFN